MIIIDLSNIEHAADILRALDIKERRKLPVGRSRSIHALRHWGLIEGGHSGYKLTPRGLEHRYRLEPLLTPAQRLAVALCASGRIDTGDGVCAGVCHARPCEHIQEVHHEWARDLLRAAAGSE